MPEYHQLQLHNKPIILIVIYFDEMCLPADLEFDDSNFSESLFMSGFDDSRSTRVNLESSEDGRRLRTS
jgi:hypothetical protein